jgi:hypothetical protein
MMMMLLVPLVPGLLGFSLLNPTVAMSIGLGLSVVNSSGRRLSLPFPMLG